MHLLGEGLLWLLHSHHVLHLVEVGHHLLHHWLLLLLQHKLLCLQLLLLLELLHHLLVVVFNFSSLLLRQMDVRVLLQNLRKLINLHIFVEQRLLLLLELLRHLLGAKLSLPIWNRHHLGLSLRKILQGHLGEISGRWLCGHLLPLGHELVHLRLCLHLVGRIRRSKLLNVCWLRNLNRLLGLLLLPLRLVRCLLRDTSILLSRLNIWH